MCLDELYLAKDLMVKTDLNVHSTAHCLSKIALKAFFFAYCYTTQK